MISNVLKIFGLSAFAFFLAFFSTPILTHYLYKYKIWKKKPRLVSEKSAGIVSLQHEKETSTPRMGGILIWFSMLIVIILFWLLSIIHPTELTLKLNFLSRGQTWLPLFTLIISSLIGLADDFFVVYGKGSYGGGGISLTKRILMVAIIGLVGSFWFYYKLDVSSINIPFWGDINLGYSFILLFVVTMLALFSGGVIDGIDGLSGGVFAAIFSAYGGIAFFQNQIDLATFCAVLVGGILAFLWFNIPPARFYMGETGILGLVTTLTVVAFLTKAVVVLPVIAFLLFTTSGSVIIQLFSKKYFHKKIFRVAPMHHHFEAIGWPSYKVTMRYWIISVIFAIIGMVIALVG